MSVRSGATPVTTMGGVLTCVVKGATPVTVMVGVCTLLGSAGALGLTTALGVADGALAPLLTVPAIAGGTTMGACATGGFAPVAAVTSRGAPNIATTSKPVRLSFFVTWFSLTLLGRGPRFNGSIHFAVQEIIFKLQ